MEKFLIILKNIEWNMKMNSIILEKLKKRKQKEEDAKQRLFL